MKHIVAQPSLWILRIIGGPADIFRLFAGRLCGRAVICDLIPLDGGGVVVFAAGELVPGVVGESVAVGVDAHPHSSRLGVGAVAVVEGIAVDLEVVFSGDIHQLMIEAEGHVSAEHAERHHPGLLVAAKLEAHLLHDAGFAGALLVGGDIVDKLSGSRTKLEYFGYVRACPLCLRDAQGGDAAGADYDKSSHSLIPNC